MGTPHVLLLAFGVAPGEGAISRAADPAWFDGWRSGALRQIAADDLGDLAALDAADHVTVVQTADLAVAWAAARDLVARGATVVLDVHAMTFRRGGALDAAPEVRVVSDPRTARAGAHAVHTRGLRKFGAPDLVALCAPEEARVVADVLTRLADALTRGEEPALPPGWALDDDAHGLAELLGLNNAARVLVSRPGAGDPTATR